MRTISLAFDGRPPLLNAERSRHWRDHRATTAAWRSEAALRYAGYAHEGQLAQVKVDVWQVVTKGALPDTGACFPAVKAIIDGAVDAGLLPHDGPEVVRHLAFWSPTRDRTMPDQLLVSIQELEEVSVWAPTGT